MSSPRLHPAGPRLSPAGLQPAHARARGKHRAKPAAGVDVGAWLRAAGLRLTPQRLAIARELAGDPTHPTAQELFERLRERLPSMSFATVYNTLAALSEKGFCAARALSPGAMRFDPNTTSHHHAVCDRCGAVIDVPAEAAQGGREVRGFSVTRVELIFRGLCDACVAVESAGERRA